MKMTCASCGNLTIHSRVKDHGCNSGKKLLPNPVACPHKVTTVCRGCGAKRVTVEDQDHGMARSLNKLLGF